MRVEFIEPEVKDTLVHRLDVRTKLVLLFCVAVLGMTLNQWRALVCLYLAVLSLVVASRLSWAKIKALVLITFLTVWGIVWVQAVFYDAYPRTPLFYFLPPGLVNPSTPVIGGLWEGIAIYYEGFTYGMAQSLRMIAPMTLGLLIYWTEDPIRVLTGLNRLKLPYAISFMVMTCLRFLPITLGEARITINSQRLRKYNPFNLKGIFLGYGIYRTTVQVMVPLLANCVRRSFNMAKSADSRAFRAYESRTELHELTVKASDKVLIFTSLCLTFAILTCKFLFYLSASDICSIYYLQPLYWIAHRYL